MKNLLNCHSVGLHSFPISFENGMYKRIFYADFNHSLWKPCEIAIHPHHVDIKITVLEGTLFNLLYEVNKDGEVYKKYKWNSHILNGNGGFELLGEERLSSIASEAYAKGESCYMKACEMHTVFVEKGEKCIWLIEESEPTCEYIPVNYSLHDLTKWTSNGLYIEVDDETKKTFISKFLNF